jgi:hypothetical protein
MARDQAEIEKSIREQFPIAFGETAVVDAEVYRVKRNALVDYALAVTGPFLSAETVRYQSILLYVSLIFIALHLFKAVSFKLGEVTIVVDRGFLLLYALFIAVIAAAFLIKAYVDFQRNRFTRAKNAEAIVDMQMVILTGQTKLNIETHFYLQTFDDIGAV